MTGDSRIPRMGEGNFSHNRLSDIELRKQISQQIAQEAMKVKKSTSAPMIQGMSAEEVEIEFEEQFEQTVIPAERPSPSPLSEETKEIDKKRQNFLYRALYSIKGGLTLLAHRVKGSKAGEKIKGFFSRLSVRKTMTSPVLFGKETLKNLTAELDRIHAEEEVGLFRIPGRTVMRTKILKDFQKQNPSNFSDKYTASDLASGLKAIFAELALFDGNKELYGRIGETVDGKGNLIPYQQRIQMCQELVASLDPDAKEILAIVLNYLAKVSSHQAKNQMTASNLATCLAQCLYKEGGADPLSEIQFVNKANAAFLFMLQNKDKIF